MRIVVNGKDVTVAEQVTVAGLVHERGLDVNAVIVELNFAIVKKEAWAQTELRTGDQIELLAFVGGG